VTDAYSPTDEQSAIVDHDGPAFVTACPGAGKTRTMVERARHVLADRTDRRGVAFLSFTNAAIDELEMRLRAFGVLPSPLFPSFIGTFDRFLWQFFVAPFGITGCDETPRLIPDKPDWAVQPFSGAQALPLSAFDRKTSVLDRRLAADIGFPVNRDATRHETRARNILAAARKRGHVDFEDVRECVKERLSDTAFAKRLGQALAARFREIVVDEAQDCNPADLEIVQWLRNSGLIVKVICDPNQSIYQFRGDVTDELTAFANRFSPNDRLPMSGNFRSTPAICSAIVALRPPSLRERPDQAFGRYKADPTPVHILSYGGSGVPARIGTKFTELAKSLGILPAKAPILASTLATAAKATGRPTLGPTEHMTLVLAQAATNYHFSFGVGSRREALVGLHKAILLVQGHIDAAGDYHSYIAAKGLGDNRWRPEIIEIAAALRFDAGMDATQWLNGARSLLAPGLSGSSTIGQRLRSSPDLGTALATPPAESHPARTIHSAKGLEFPAVCVVLTSQKTGDILSHLEGNGGGDFAEDARKIYVAASRAQRLLAIAIPKGGALRLQNHLASCGCPTVLHTL
jgi:DNA helicase II / ATP-dependent DNA helicase PcrA